MRPTKEDMLAYLAEAQRIQTALFGKVQMSIHCYTYGEHFTIDIVLTNLAVDTQRMISAEAKEALYDKPTWRPSKEQMQMLHRSVVATAPGPVHDGIESLYNDLKNL